jgi:hypothetical protein
MSSVAGTYDCVAKSPVGDQKSVLTFVVDGDTVTGTNAGANETMEIENGKVDGNTLTWEMRMTFPMPLKLECSATVDGDALTGTIKAGMLGSMAMSGVRQG